MWGSEERAWESASRDASSPFAMKQDLYSKHLPCLHTVLYTHKLVLLYTVQVERVPGLFTKNAFFLLGERGASRWLERVVCMCTMFRRDDGSDTVYIGLRTRLLYLDG